MKNPREPKAVKALIAKAEAAMKAKKPKQFFPDATLWNRLKSRKPKRNDPHSNN